VSIDGAARIAGAVRRLTERRDEFAAELLNLFAMEIAPLQHDDNLLDLLAAGIDGSVSSGLYLLENDVDPQTIPAPGAAVEYARRLAQRAIPVSALLRAYRLGSSAFVELMIAEVAADPDVGAAEASAASVAILRKTTAFVDNVSEQLVIAYEEERELWEKHHSMVRAARIKGLLDGSDVDEPAFEAASGYRLRQTHIAVLLWFTGRGDDPRLLETTATAVANQLSAACLFTPVDSGSAMVWLGRPGTVADAYGTVEALTRALTQGVHAAVGEPGVGPGGLRASHRQARAARGVAMAAGPAAEPVTSFTDVGIIALLCSDLAATRLWIADTLGELAVDDENNARLRETVRVFLNLGSSHTAASERLHLHKNTVQYRIAKAEAVRGRPIRADRADVELALRACQVLGAAVLQPGN
jgi:hypothetical protein